MIKSSFMQNKNYYNNNYKLNELNKNLYVIFIYNSKCIIKYNDINKSIKIIVKKITKNYF